jgi:5-methylcytosine-specific restriction endonuclease McrA
MPGLTTLRDPRDTRRWRQLRKQVLRNASHCAICNLPLDFSARPCTRWAPSVDHIVALARGGAAFDPSNLQATHYSCNAAKGAGRGRTVRLVQQEEPVGRADWW